MPDGASVEVATVGNEGVVGVPVILGSRRTMTKAVNQYPGDALKLPASQLQREMQVREAIDLIMRQYAYALLRQIIQSAGCNALHSVEQRFARFLLTMQDRTAAADFPLAQRFIADMLGVRRETVALVAGSYITYTRGTVTILDHVGLSGITCECYDKIRTELQLAMK
jgi:CRP-like cAMP-binding protein